MEVFERALESLGRQEGGEGILLNTWPLQEALAAHVYAESSMTSTFPP